MSREIHPDEKVPLPELFEDEEPLFGPVDEDWQSSKKIEDLSAQIVEDQLIQLAAEPACEEETLPEGTILARAFEVVKALGQGGMSQVYLCRDLALKRMVAVKLLHGSHSKGSISRSATARLQTEGRAIARLKHANIVDMYGFQTTESGQPFLVMEVVNGTSLADLLLHKGPLPVLQVLKYVNQICRALEHAHSCGVIHRDLKPENIMITNQGRHDEQVKLLDFGIAKLVDDSAIKLTQTGEVFGSPAYMSPEQALGKRVDERSDQYSLGCVIFELLTGRPPFESESALTILMAHAQEKSPTLAKVTGKQFPHSLESALARMLAKDPADRYATMTDANDALAGMSSKPPPAKGKPGHLLYIGAAFALLATLCICLAVRVCSVSSHREDTKGVAGGASHEKTPRAGSATQFESMPAADQGAEITPGAALTQSLRHGEVKETLDLSGSDIKDSDLHVLPKFLDAHIRDLSLKDCSQITDAGLHYLVQLPELESLNLDGTPITDAGLETISKIDTLKKLVIRNVGNIDDSGVERLHALQNLQYLDVAGNNINGSCFSRFKSLDTLCVDATRVKENLRLLIPLRLNILYANDNELSDKDMETLSRLTTLKQLHLEKNREITDTGALRLLKLHRLAVLSLRRTAVTPTGLEMLAAKFAKAHQDCQVFPEPDER